jgi:hypothetical protein
MEHIKLVNAKAGEGYRYMNFDQIPTIIPPIHVKPEVGTGAFLCRYHVKEALYLP